MPFIYIIERHETQTYKKIIYQNDFQTSLFIMKWVFRKYYKYDHDYPEINVNVMLYL